jgi:phosphoribosylglycinamide formyltransferase 1
MKSIIIFASGSGTNARAIIQYFRMNPIARVSLIVCNKKNAGVLDIATTEGIPSKVVNRNEFENVQFSEELLAHRPSLLVLAGFLWKIPDYLIAAFPDQILNIHPSLLPKYGGQGMYGMKVHEQVIANHEKNSGITIHRVNNIYDAGEMLLQAHCSVHPTDTAATLAERIHHLEHYYYPRVLEYMLTF